ncbi:hypothetical protein E4U43_002304 [Claviceps pusilla]|uniref:Metallo-beta-lactamase domain-containing protein n=1 Tax=Claviceps pusilla TaxID=123648 RepID=A0A9P7SZM1_9HYPO|nr:hypothetical protein E4U43_002304 [Claviceps pusilla]
MASASASASAPTCSTRVTKIPGRSRLPDEAASNPHHIIKKGDTTVSGFKNPYPSWSGPVGLWSFFRNVGWPTLTGRLKKPDTSPPTVPVQRPEWLPDRTSSSSSSSSSSGKLRATWLGHACYYVEFPSGLRVLFDPVFEHRCSPLSFAGPKRYTERPCRLQDIPVIDAVVISHSHYDHLSRPSVVEIQKHHPDVQFFVGLGLETWFRKSGLNNVTELDWWEDAELSVTIPGKKNKAAKPKMDERASKGQEEDEEEEEEEREQDQRPRVISARISALPCQHTSARSPWDKDTTLWCSWAVISDGKSVWFGGDTGYRAVPRLPPGTDDYAAEYASLPRCPQFEQIGQLRGPFDLGLIPIGAYCPRVAFSTMHANPFDSVEIFVDTRCERAMGIHWGTWALTMEEVLEPPRLLREALKKKGIAEEGVFDVCDIGESRQF